MRQKIIITIATILTFGWIALLDYEGKKYNESINALNEVITTQNELIINLQKEIDGNVINVDHLMDDMNHLMDLCLEVTSFI